MEWGRAKRQGKKGRKKRMEIRMEGGNREGRKGRRRRKQGFIGEEPHACFASFKKYNLEGDPMASGTKGKTLGHPLSVKAGQQGAHERGMRFSGQTCLSHLERSPELHQALVSSH